MTLQPFSLLSMNYVNSLTKTKNNKRYIFNVMNYFSRFTMTHATSDNENNITVHCLHITFEQYINSVVIFTDLDTHFDNEIMQQFLRKRKISLTHASTASFKSVSMIEQINQIIQKIIAAAEVSLNIDLKDSLESGSF